MWPFKTRQAVDQAHLELVSQIHGLTQELKSLRDDLASLEDRHERLRGKFYATRQAQPPGGKTKEQLLAEHFARMNGGRTP